MRMFVWKEFYQPGRTTGGSVKPTDTFQIFVDYPVFVQMIEPAGDAEQLPSNEDKVLSESNQSSGRTNSKWSTPGCLVMY